jgi:hypothetical protein
MLAYLHLHLLLSSRIDAQSNHHMRDITRHENSLCNAPMWWNHTIGASERSAMLLSIIYLGSPLPVQPVYIALGYVHQGGMTRMPHVLMQQSQHSGSAIDVPSRAVPRSIVNSLFVAVEHIACNMASM